jgi:2-dehydro-3-deoxyphosphooctonate aldolase (KDO 8-P synthase)
MAVIEIHPVLKTIAEDRFESFFLIAGPCAVESKDVCLAVGQECKNIAHKLGVPYIFKASYLKANRTKKDSFRTIGIQQAINIIKVVREELDVPVTTDVHEVTDVKLVSDVVDLIQIPAFLSRQSLLIEAAALTGKPVNIKKGQFMSASSMVHAVQKLDTPDHVPTFISERGNSFGYSDLIVDMPNIASMKSHCSHVIMDCTHATQRPNQDNGVTSGNPEVSELLARAALSVGARGLFIETHPNPEGALSDGSNMIELSKMEALVTRLHHFSFAINQL